MIKRCKSGNCSGCVFEETVRDMGASWTECSVWLCLNKKYVSSDFDDDENVLQLQCPYYYAKKDLVNDVIRCMNDDV